VPIVEELTSSRDGTGELTGHVRIGDLSAVFVDRIQQLTVDDPEKPGETIEIEVVIGVMETALRGNGGGEAPSGAGDRTVIGLQLVR
jgi:hypothetical protein